MLCKVLPRLHHKPFLRHCTRLRYHSCKAHAAADLQSPISGRDSHTVFVCLSTHDHDDVHHYLMEDHPVFIVYLKLEQRIPSCHLLWPGLASAAMKSKKLVKSLRVSLQVRIRPQPPHLSTQQQCFFTHCTGLLCLLLDRL